jgi:hypothetical protein
MQQKNKNYRKKPLAEQMAFNYYLFAFLFILINIDFSFGVLYLSASVGSMFKNRFTTATGMAIVNLHTPLTVSIAKNPIG